MAAIFYEGKEEGKRAKGVIYIYLCVCVCVCVYTVGTITQHVFLVDGFNGGTIIIISEWRVCTSPVYGARG